MFKHLSIAKSSILKMHCLNFANNCPRIWGQFIRHFFSFPQEEMKRLQNPLKKVNEMMENNDGKYLLEK